MKYQKEGNKRTLGAKCIKKCLLVLLLGVIFFFPEKVFSGLAGIFIILLVLFLMVEVFLDVYIVAVFFYQEYKKKIDP